MNRCFLLLGALLFACDEPTSFRLDAASEASVEDVALTDVVSEQAVDATSDVRMDVVVDVERDAENDARSDAVADAVADVDVVADVPVDARNDGGPPRVTVQLLSRTPAGNAGNNASEVSGQAVSRDGRYVVFTSLATDLTTNTVPEGVVQVYLRDTMMNTTRLLSVSSGGVAGDRSSSDVMISADGGTVAFASKATNLSGPLGTDTRFTRIYVWRRATGQFEVLQTQAEAGLIPYDLIEGGVAGLSETGNVLLFRTRTVVVPPRVGMPNNEVQTYEVDLGVGPSSFRLLTQSAMGEIARFPASEYCQVTERVFGGANMWGYELSADGQVAIIGGNGWGLTEDDPATDSCTDLFVHHRTRRELTRVQFRRATDFSVNYAGITRTGSEVMLVSLSTRSLIDNNTHSDLYVGAPGGMAWELVSQNTAGMVGNASSTAGRLSEDGRRAIFVSRATNLVSGDTNANIDIFLRDRDARMTTRVSLTTDGQQIEYGGMPLSTAVYNENIPPAFSGDGTTVVFVTPGRASPNDTNGVKDVYLARIE